MFRAKGTYAITLGNYAQNVVRETGTLTATCETSTDAYGPTTLWQSLSRTYQAPRTSNAKCTQQLSAFGPSWPSQVRSPDFLLGSCRLSPTDGNDLFRFCLRRRLPQGSAKILIRTVKALLDFVQIRHLGFVYISQRRLRRFNAVHAIGNLGSFSLSQFHGLS
jgi:hypothetical protein